MKQIPIIKNGYQIKAGLKAQNLLSTGTRADVFLYGVIGWEINVGSFQEEIKKLPNDTKEINFYLHSPGGYVSEGFVLLTTLARLRSKYYTRMFIDGQAASMGSAIALEADETHASPTSEMMIHSAWSGLDIYGGFNSNEIDALIEDLKTVKESLDVDTDIMASFYAAKTGLSVEEIKSKFLDGKDHYLSPEKMLEFGFIDSIIDFDLPKPDAIEFEEESAWLDGAMKSYKAAASSIKTPYRGIFDKKLSTFAFSKQANYNKEVKSQQKLDIMNKIVAKILGLDVNSSEEIITSGVQALADKNKSLEAKLTAQQTMIDDLKTAKQSAEDKVNQLSADVLATKATSIVNEVKTACATKGMQVNKNIDDSLNALAVSHLKALEEGDETSAKNFKEHMELKAKASLIPVGEDPNFKSKDDRSSEGNANLSKEHLEKVRAEAIAKAKANADKRKRTY